MTLLAAGRTERLAKWRSLLSLIGSLAHASRAIKPGLVGLLTCQQQPGDLTSLYILIEK